MNQYVTGSTIRELREGKNLTQAELAEKLHVSDKTISKWENAKGYPDVSLLEPIAQALDISVTELLCGRVIQNINISANMMRSKFYVCPVCANIIHSTGEAVVQCHGVLLSPLQAEAADARHPFHLSPVEDEYFVHIDHEMTKEHYISFIAALGPDGLQMIKLYPEGNCEARLKRGCVQRILFYCNRDGLFSIDCQRANKRSEIDVHRQ